MNNNLFSNNKHIDSYETPVKFNTMNITPKLLNLQSIKTDFHSSRGGEDNSSSNSEEEEEYIFKSHHDNFSLFLDELCGPFHN